GVKPERAATTGSTLGDSHDVEAGTRRERSPDSQTDRGSDGRSWLFLMMPVRPLIGSHSTAGGGAIACAGEWGKLGLLNPTIPQASMWFLTSLTLTCADLTNSRNGFSKTYV